MSPRESGRKGGRSRSPAKQAAARINGRNGGEHGAKGARHGKKGGRPRKHRYYELFAALPDAMSIDDTLEMASWFVRAILITTSETMNGRGNPKLNSELRASSKVIAQLIPRERLKKAEEAVAAEVKKSTGKKNQPRGMALTTAPIDSTPIRARDQ